MKESENNTSILLSSAVFLYNSSKTHLIPNYQEIPHIRMKNLTQKLN